MERVFVPSPTERNHNLEIGWSLFGRRWRIRRSCARIGQWLPATSGVGGGDRRGYKGRIGETEARIHIGMWCFLLRFSVKVIVIARCVRARSVSAVVVDRSLYTDMADDDMTERERKKETRA
jgi:hypothetical protein